ncbi:MAG: hypothetical protein RI967_1884 [Planctomycetota bacterium]
MPARRRPEVPPIPAFEAELAARIRPDGDAAPSVRRTILALPDQLSVEIGPLRGAVPAETRVLLLESGEWLSRRPYHRQRLAWILLSQRTFALELAERGHRVELLRGDAPMIELLRAWLERADADATLPIECMEPAEREVRAELAPLVAEGRILLRPHDGFLTTAADLEPARVEGGWRMDRFYQAVRRRTGILMADGKPIGGKFSFDAENRRRWDGDPAAPEPPAFVASLVREEIVAEIESRFEAHPGALDLSTIPATRLEIERFWQWAERHCLPRFGPYEDAMSRKSRGLFHTRLSPLMNLHRLLPSRVLADTLALDLPLASKEGFVRQLIGWREFVYRIHRETDGFRSVVRTDEAPLASPGDGGFSSWSGRAWTPKAPPPAGVDGGARPNALDAREPLPAAWWGTESGLQCLDHVVGDVWEEGWSHHITRLMVLANLATLAGVAPRELCDWFWAAYIDSWDWVVEPNVLAMGTYGFTGMTTKPYVSGAAYLEKMGDSCRSCRFKPGVDCPVTPMYWSFLARNHAVLCDNPRMKLPIASAVRRSAEQSESDRAALERVRRALHAGVPVEGGRAVTAAPRAREAGLRDPGLWEDR